MKSLPENLTIILTQVAETRSENRTYRPRVELCRDEPHDGIIAERNDLMNTVSTLIDQHNIAEYVLDNGARSLLFLARVIRIEIFACIGDIY